MEDKEKDALQQQEGGVDNENLESHETAQEKPVDTPKSEEEQTPRNTEKASGKPLEEESAKATESIEEQPEEEDHHHNEVESDEHEEVDEYATVVKELPDYEHMPLGEIIKEGKKLLEHGEPQNIKEEMEAIHTAAIKVLDDVRNDKLHTFVEEGGHEIDFEYDQPERREIQRIYKEYKKQRSTYYKKLEEQLIANLDVKKAIIEEVKNLPNIEGSVPEKYKHFRDLQERWSNTGPVPRQESNQLWNNYHHHVDNFYDFLRISNQLRELDFKKNLDAKTELCVEAEALAEEDANRDTFTKLQELHAKWKKIGPVDREHREPMWERFSAATKTIHDKRHEFFKQLRENREELIEKKKELVETMKTIELDKLNTHGAWQSAIKKMDELRNAFRQIGRINLPENDTVWEAFREVNKNFNRTKNQFYKQLKAEHHKNLERKEALLARANELKESENWREAASELKRIQSDWKKIGYVPRKESDRIWKEFRAACNHFFDRLTAHNKGLDKEFEGNLEKKRGILERLEQFSATAKAAGKKELRAFIEEWKNAGRVPRGSRDIEGRFNQLLDEHFKKLKVDKREASMMRFENKVHTMINADNSRELGREKDHLKRQLDEAKKELRQLENNIQFFAHVDEKNPLVREANKNIERQKEQIELIKSKLTQLDKMQNAPAPSTKAEEEEAQTINLVEDKNVVAKEEPKTPESES